MLCPLVSDGDVVTRRKVPDGDVVSTSDNTENSAYKSNIWIVLSMHVSVFPRVCDQTFTLRGRPFFKKHFHAFFICTHQMHFCLAVLRLWYLQKSLITHGRNLQSGNVI